MNDQSLRCTHIIPAVAEEASGPSYVVVRLVESLVQQGAEAIIVALDRGPNKAPPSILRSFPVGMGPKKLGRSPTMLRWLLDEGEAGRVDLLHSHGMWMMPCVYPGWAARACAVELMVSPHGTLAPWAMSSGSLLKRLFWPSLQRPALDAASCFHATAETEYEDIRRLGFEQPVAIIPIGIDIPSSSYVATPSVANADRFRTLLFLSRIHHGKGVDVLLRSWAVVVDRFPEWQLSIVGPEAGYDGDDGYFRRMQNLAFGELKLKRVHFQGALYGEAKWAAYRNADLFVLPTRSENFGIAVAEALAAGTPAIVTKGAPWEGLVRHEAGWWIDFGVDSLVACLDEAMNESPLVLTKRGTNGREWMIQDFSWDKSGRMMNQAYQWLVNGGDRPKCVRID